MEITCLRGSPFPSLLTCLPSNQVIYTELKKKKHRLNIKLTEATLFVVLNYNYYPNGKAGSQHRAGTD